MQRLLAFILLAITLPFWPLLYLVVKFDSCGPFIFRQKRAGRGKKPFTIYKIRTMVVDAENLKSKYAKLNEASGPVFKIKNDPRFTKVGKILAKYAFDELPQLINVVLGEMALVGPRPLPVNEAKKIPRKYEARFTVLPGMTSTWILKGAHKLKFKQWMKLDIQYVKKKSTWYDIKIFAQTILMLLKVLL